MLGILANFDKEDVYKAVKTIIEQVHSYSKSDFAESRYFRQLRIFVQLRNSVEQQFEKAMESVSTFFREEKDFLYRKGAVKGREEKEREVVTNLILQSGLSDEQIAAVAGVPVSFVKVNRDGLKK